MDLFSQGQIHSPGTPLAEKLRPQDAAMVLGQLAAEKILNRVRRSGQLSSLILWGPPGTGKTSFALALIREMKCETLSVNAVEVGAKALRELGQKARETRQQYGRQTVLFIDEIHRLNKSQQDVLLPFIEKGEFVLIGATTENPSYELNRALMSRCQLVVFERLNGEHLRSLAQRAFQASGLEPIHLLKESALEELIATSDGDARKLLSIIEILIQIQDAPEYTFPVTPEVLRDLVGARAVGYDKQGDQHYDVVSAFIKSIRGSDANAGLYYLARMLKAGEDPVFIARRLVILASEDVGNADPRALSMAVAGAQAVELIGLPEGAINLAQVVTYLASAPKSNRSYLGLKRAQESVEQTGTLPIPLHLRSSKTDLMANLGYGKDYAYPHEARKGFVDQNYLPDGLRNTEFYIPSERGFEKQIQEFQKWLKS
jgi:putative ATPase